MYIVFTADGKQEYTTDIYKYVTAPNYKALLLKNGYLFSISPEYIILIKNKYEYFYQSYNPLKDYLNFSSNTIYLRVLCHIEMYYRNQKILSILANTNELHKSL